MDARTLTLFVLICLAVFHGVTTSAAAQVASGLPCTANMVADSAAVDVDMAHWLKKRALYLHDLKLSSLEQKSGSVSEAVLDIADKLVDANLYVAYAEADRLALDKSLSADNDMHQALYRLDEAYELAAGDVKTKIAAVRTKLVSTRDVMKVCNGADYAQQRDEYETLRRDIDELVNHLG